MWSPTLTKHFYHVLYRSITPYTNHPYHPYTNHPYTKHPYHPWLAGAPKSSSSWGIKARGNGSHTYGWVEVFIPLHSQFLLHSTIEVLTRSFRILSRINPYDELPLVYSSDKEVRICKNTRCYSSQTDHWKWRDFVISNLCVNTLCFLFSQLTFALPDPSEINPINMKINEFQLC